MNQSRYCNNTNAQLEAFVELVGCKDAESVAQCLGDAVRTTGAPA